MNKKRGNFHNKRDKMKNNLFSHQNTFNKKKGNLPNKGERIQLHLLKHPKTPDENKEEFRNRSEKIKLDLHVSRRILQTSTSSPEIESIMSNIKNLIAPLSPEKAFTKNYNHSPESTSSNPKVMSNLNTVIPNVSPQTIFSKNHNYSPESTSTFHNVVIKTSSNNQTVYNTLFPTKVENNNNHKSLIKILSSQIDKVMSNTASNLTVDKMSAPKIEDRLKHHSFNSFGEKIRVKLPSKNFMPKRKKTFSSIESSAKFLHGKRSKAKHKQSSSSIESGSKFLADRINKKVVPKPKPVLFKATNRIVPRIMNSRKKSKSTKRNDYKKRLGKYFCYNLENMDKITRYSLYSFVSKYLSQSDLNVLENRKGIPVGGNRSKMAPSSFPALQPKLRKNVARKLNLGNQTILVGPWNPINEIDHEDSTPKQRWEYYEFNWV